ncbi:MAG TPA: sugar ABC transporter permease [Trueperaceae bacterium]|nr:sugar ABC transporter permease [Trueperaceae bacterium]
MKRISSWFDSDGVLATLLVSPSVIWMLAIIGYPVLLVFWLSVHGQAGFSGAAFVGLDNYLFILGRSDFWSSALKTVAWTVGNIVLILPLGVLVALLLNMRFYGQRFFRTWVLLPWAFPIVVTVLMWQWILNPVVGVLNHLLLSLNIVDQPVSFFANGTSAMIVVILVNVWRWTPFVTVVALAALQTIPTEYYEAARIDGASGPQTTWNITLPLIWPTLGNTVFILLIWLFNMFPPLWLMTKGGPVDATTTLPLMVYQRGLEQFRMGEAASISVLLLVLFVVPLALLYFSRQRDSVTG